MEAELLYTILVVVTQVVAYRNETTTDIIKSEENNTVLPRQAGYGLIKFDEGHANPIQVDNLGEPNAYGLVTFEDQPSNRPFRFETNHNGFNKLTIDSQEFGGQNLGSNHDIDSQGYGIYKPEGFGNQPPNLGLNNPEEHSVFGSSDPTSNLNNPEGQSGYGLVFQDDNRIEVNSPANAGQKKRKRRRRRRKPKQLAGPGYGFAPPVVGGPGLRVPMRPGLQYPVSFASGQPYRPPRRPRPSVAEGALASVTSALASIARYDDLQCVPRLICEVAGGQSPITGATAAAGGQSPVPGAAGSGILQTIVNLQPLVTLLAAYNGVSSSPLFVFGRAALLGMTSKANAGTCRYAYSQCPSDPEKLVEYLNNHNGGFFRFFSNPQPYSQQNLEQFYSQLSGNYGLFQPQGNGYPNQNLGGSPDANFGSYPNGNGGVGPNQYQQLAGQYPGLNGPEGLGYQGYGFPNPGQFNAQPIPSPNGFQNPVPGQNYGLYQGSQQNYGFGYPYQQGQFKNAAEDVIEKNTIEKRIQNRPDVTYVGGGELFGSDLNTKWAFPDSKRNEIVKNKQRFGRTVVFPEKESSPEFHKEPNVETTQYVQQNIDSNKKATGFNFPENQSNRQYIDYYDYPPYTRILDGNNFKLDEQGFYVESNEESDYYNQENKENKENEEGVELVYVLRGNGDPSMPEIIKLRPGQKVQ